MQVAENKRKFAWICEDGGVAEELALAGEVAISFSELAEKEREGKVPPAPVASLKFGTIRRKGFEPIVLLRSTNFIGWAISLRSSLKGNVAILADFEFDIKAARNAWAEWQEEESPRSWFNNYRFLEADAPQAREPSERTASTRVAAWLLGDGKDCEQEAPERTVPEVRPGRGTEFTQFLDKMAEAPKNTPEPGAGRQDEHYEGIAERVNTELDMVATLAKTLLRKKKLSKKDKELALEYAGRLESRDVDISERLRIAAEK